MNFKPYILRLGIVFAACLLVVILFNEVAFQLQKDHNDRPPETIEIVIPAGTSEKLADGVEVVSLPSDLEFVLGDTLLVKNEDVVNHQLGPVWVPPDASGSLVLNRAEKLAYSCSFQSSRYLDLDVNEPTTLNTRMIGIGVAAPTLTALIFIYSLVLWPINGKKSGAVESPSDSSAED